MSQFTTQWLEDRERRQQLQKRGVIDPEPSDPALKEVGKGGLQQQILDYCAGQWPRWKVTNARSCERSTLEPGHADFIIWMPGGRFSIIETKAKVGKLPEDQRNWAHEMNRLGHTVHVVWSMAEFLEVIRQPCTCTGQRK